MGTKGHDLYTNSGETYTPADISAMQAKVVEATKENLRKRNNPQDTQEPVQSPKMLQTLGGFQSTETSSVELQNLPEREMRAKLLSLADKKFGEETWCRGVGIATGNRLRLNIMGNYEGEIPDEFMGIKIEKVYVDKFRPRKGGHSK